MIIFYWFSIISLFREIFILSLYFLQFYLWLKKIRDLNRNVYWFILVSLNSRLHFPNMAAAIVLILLLPKMWSLHHSHQVVVPMSPFLCSLLDPTLWLSYPRVWQKWVNVTFKAKSQMPSISALISWGFRSWHLPAMLSGSPSFLSNLSKGIPSTQKTWRPQFHQDLP